MAFSSLESIKSLRGFREVAGKLDDDGCPAKLNYFSVSKARQLLSSSPHELERQTKQREAQLSCNLLTRPANRFNS